MAGHASNWFKPTAGPLKGQAVYLSKAQQAGMSRLQVEQKLRLKSSAVTKQANTERPAGAASPSARPAPSLGTEHADKSRLRVQAKANATVKVRSSVLANPDVFALFGRQPTVKDLGGLVGAMNGAKLLVMDSSDTMLSLEVKHRHYTSYRQIYRDPSGNLTIVNSDFRVNEKAPRGVASRVVGRQMEQAGALGVKKIKLNAAGDPKNSDYNGYYTWARLGFNAPLSEGIKTRLPAKLKSNDMHELFDKPEGAAWWKANGEAISMEFDPTPNSPHRKRLDQYLAAGGIDPYSEV